MDDRLPNPLDPGTQLLVRGDLLSPVVRRDIADLNRLYLGLSLEPLLDEDPRFALADSVRAALGDCPDEVRRRLAECPFCLFQLRLPAGGSNVLDRVADARQPMSLEPPTAARCHSFVLLALSVARQLAGGAPLSPRIALGVSADAESQLAAMCPSDLARLAAWPGLVRPRWPRHVRFWGMLMAAARTSDAALARWAHCAGLCLLMTVQDGLELPDEPVRRRVRHPRGWPGPGVSC
ncbi:MAG TPA: hypothetical protein VF277_03930 [Steroidobacteraceae bacterium]